MALHDTHCHGSFGTSTGRRYEVLRKRPSQGQPIASTAQNHGSRKPAWVTTIGRSGRAAHQEATVPFKLSLTPFPPSSGMMCRGTPAKSGRGLRDVGYRACRDIRRYALRVALPMPLGRLPSVRVGTRTLPRVRRRRRHAPYCFGFHVDACLCVSRPPPALPAAP